LAGGHSASSALLGTSRPDVVSSMRMVLVHGSLCTASVWDRVVPELAAMGHEAIAVDLPGHGATKSVPATLETYCGAVLEQAQPGDVLVGHSSGGWAITLAVDAAPQMFRHLVYLAAALPEEGRPAGARRISVPKMQQYTQVSPDGKWSEFVSFEGARRHLFNDCDEEDARTSFENLCPEPLTQLAQPISVPTFWKSNISRSYILCTDDRAYPIDYMRDAAKALEVEPILIDSGHFPMISRPHEIARLLVQTAE
jgi:pimeloyl-ACP methyl ester carboxylesterase